MKNFKLVFVSIFLLGLVACHTYNDSQQNQQQPLSEDSLIKLNKRLVHSEKEEIDRFIKTKGWPMKETATGLRYFISQHGNGARARSGRMAVIRYKLSLLNGTLLDSSDKSGLKTFEIGHGGVERGLEEGILLLKVGDKAKFILPSHLAYGLTGEGSKIPPQSPLIYDIEFVKLN